MTKMPKFHEFMGHDIRLADLVMVGPIHRPNGASNFSPSIPLYFKDMKEAVVIYGHYHRLVEDRETLMTAWKGKEV